MTTATEAPAAVNVPTAFLSALFDPRDHILIRPIETWTEDGKKHARTLYKQTRVLRAKDLAHPNVWRKFLEMSATERANLFFGVCPRPGPNHDLAWQIRVARVLWADVDHCTADEALKRCAAAGLPRPSIIVCSGNGVHLYWLLVEPYVIDDGLNEPPADPLTGFPVSPSVREEWPEGDPDSGKKRRPRKWFKHPETGEKVYEHLDEARKRKNPHWPEVSPKGKRIQFILSGIAAKIDGDHTQDLARLLREPGTMNRKDERNGKAPVPCELVECDPARRYPLADFERFAEASPDKQKADRVARIKLPSGKRLTAGRRNTLSDKLNVCSVTPIGERSEPDFHALCWAIEHGLDKEAVWGMAQDVGKFSEGGRRYFDLTWEKAEGQAREKIYERACRKAGVQAARGEGPPHANGSANGQVPSGSGPDRQDDDGDDSPTSTNDRDENPHRLAGLWKAARAQADGAPWIRFYREAFYRYDGKRWRVLADSELRGELTAFCRAQLVQDNALRVANWTSDSPPPPTPEVTHALIGNVMQAIAGDVGLAKEIAQPAWITDKGKAEPRNFIAVDNGLLDVDALLAGRDDFLLPHSPRWFSPVCLPYPFDPDATCPTWNAFLARNLGDSAAKQNLLRLFAGYTTLPDTSYQRYLAMFGEGSNGKSVVCTVFREMLGEDNVSAVPLEMFGEKFALLPTLGKLANIVTEVGELDKVAEAQIKAFVVGDPMQFEQKFKTPFWAKPTARLVLATNNPPQYRDKSEGIWRRTLLLKFTVQIPREEQIAGMDKAEFWHQRGELPGILNWALSGLHSLRTAGGFPDVAECREDMEHLRGESNPARRFLLENYQAGVGETSCATLYDEYKYWCRDRGHNQLSETSFGKEVARRFPAVKRERRGPRGHRYWTYIGLIDAVEDAIVS